jgi:hypothetical protein
MVRSKRLGAHPAWFGIPERREPDAADPSDGPVGPDDPAGPDLVEGVLT